MGVVGWCIWIAFWEQRNSDVHMPECQPAPSIPPPSAVQLLVAPWRRGRYGWKRQARRSCSIGGGARGDGMEAHHHHHHHHEHDDGPRCILIIMYCEATDIQSDSSISSELHTVDGVPIFLCFFFICTGRRCIYIYTPLLAISLLPSIPTVLTSIHPLLSPPVVFPLPFGFACLLWSPDPQTSKHIRSRPCTSNERLRLASCKCCTVHPMKGKQTDMGN